MRYRIMDLEVSQRPRERLAELGAPALSNAELLAILLATGRHGKSALELGVDLLSSAGGLAGLQRLTYDGLCGMSGIGPAKAAQLISAIELGRRLASREPGLRQQINSPEDAANLLLYEMSALEQEQLRVLLLNNRNHLLRCVQIYQGSLNASAVRIAEVFKPAVRAAAAAIIVVHNHPSGDPTPSPEDVAVTEALLKAGKLLDIDLLDHIIVGQNRFVSLKRMGLGF